MKSVIAVHGIAQQLKGPETLRTEWLAPMIDGVRMAGQTLKSENVAFAFYGDLFRGAEVRRSGNDQWRATDVEAGFETELLAQWWRAAAIAEPNNIFPPDATTRGTRRFVQAALQTLTRSRFFTRLAEGAIIGNLKQVSAYMHDPCIRKAARASLDAVVTPESRVIVAHSLGSVVAYEALHQYVEKPNWAGVTTLVTLGSPLGIRNLIFDALDPAPVGNKAAWPILVQRWTNVSDDGDIVALQKKLGNLFSERVVDISIDNEANAHAILPYLTARATGEAIAHGLG